MYTFSSFTSPSIDIWKVFLFWPLEIILPYIFMYKFLCGRILSFLLDKHPGLELLGPVTTLCFHLWRKSQAVFQSAYVTFCSHKPCVRVLLLRPFVHFSIVSFAFLLLSCKSASYMLETSPLSDTWFASNFSYSMSCPSLSWRWDPLSQLPLQVLGCQRPGAATVCLFPDPEPSYQLVQLSLSSFILFLSYPGPFNH